MMLKMLYVLGVPGAGKTTTLRMALELDLHWHVEMSEPIPHMVHGWNVMPTNVTIHEIGVQREGGFGGTDGLPMNVQPKVLEWLAGARPSRVIAEGDRLGNDKFFRAVRMMGYDLSIIYLTVPPHVAEERRQARARVLGKAPQNASWVQGRHTKTYGLVATHADTVTVIEGEQPPEWVARELRNHPFFHGLPPYSGGM